MSIIMAFLGLGFLIFIHELGHYWVGRATGIRVEQFAIGFGPAIARTVRNGIEYRLNWIPLGGYVKFLGEDKEEGIDAPDSFQNRPIWARFLTLIAGVVMNVLGAIVIITALLAINGTPTNKWSIQNVTPNSPAAAAGFQPGDQLVKVNGTPIESSDTLASALSKDPTHPAVVTVNRQGHLLNLQVTPGANHRIGVSLQPVYEKIHNPLVNIKNGLIQTGNIFSMLIDGLRQLVVGQVSFKQVSGPVEIIKITTEQYQAGISNYLSVVAVLSLNLAVINLLPLPALDGGRLVFLLIEFLRRGKRIPIEKEASINFIGLIFLFALMIIVTFKDVTHLFS